METLSYVEIFEIARKEYPPGTWIKLDNGEEHKVVGDIRMAKYYHALIHDGWGQIYDFRTKKWVYKLTEEEINNLKL